MVSIFALANVQAQNDARALADREAAQESYKQLNSDVQGLVAAQEVTQKRLNALAEDLKRSREEQASSAASTASKYVTREELKDLVAKIKEIDQKREADKKLILEELAKLTKLMQTPPPAPVPVHKKEKEKPEPKAKEDKPASTEPEKGFYHEVQKGEYLSTIIAAYNAQFKEDGKKTVTEKQVLDANPEINPKTKTVRKGQKLFIPDPGK
jgi:seryl-tRNA synthetase